jgi:hypothetical protein
VLSSPYTASDRLAKLKSDARSDGMIRLDSRTVATVVGFWS